MNKNSTQVRTSRYVSGGTSEVNSNAIEWWERATFSLDPTDQQYIVEKKFEGRLDLITGTFLGVENARYWWAIAMLNNVLDPYTEIQEGVVLYLPSVERFKSMIGGGTIGGVPSTRELLPSIKPIV